MLELTRISTFVERHFPEREFHYRSGGAVRYFRLSTEIQVAIAGGVAFVMCWTIALTLWAFLGPETTPAERKLASKLSEARAKMTAVEREYASLQARIDALRARKARADAELKRSREEFARAISLKGGLATKAQKPKLAIETKAKFLAAGIARDGASAGSARRQSVFDRLAGGATTGSASLGGAVSGVVNPSFAVAGVRARNRSLINEREKLWQQVANLRAGLDRMRNGRAILLTRLDNRTRRNIDEIERVIVMTGLNPKDLLARMNDNGKGGPAIAVPASVGATDAYATRVIRLTKRLKRWERLQAILRSMPLIAPLDHYRKSSGFGKRRDPISGRWSSHNGLDFAYHRNSPVLSTAAGTVTFAGWRGGYGWMIEIDHGMGIRTRYAHLKKILVEKGQKLAFRDKIGLLGSSGRSSGPHVHYEVVVDGRPRNPMKFITAGKYVFKR